MEIEPDTKTRKRESIPMTRESVSRKSTTESRMHESDDRKKFATLKLAVESICREANQKNIVPTGEPIVRVTQFGTTDGYVCFIKYAVPQYVWNNVRWTSKSISDTLESHIRESIEHKGITIDRQPKRASAYSVHIVNVSNPSHRITVRYTSIFTKNIMHIYIFRRQSEKEWNITMMIFYTNITLKTKRKVHIATIPWVYRGSDVPIIRVVAIASV